MTAPIGPGDYVQSIVDCTIVPQGSVWLILAVISHPDVRPYTVGLRGQHKCPPEGLKLSGPSSTQLYCPLCFSPFSGPEQAHVRVCEEVEV